MYRILRCVAHVCVYVRVHAYTCTCVHGDRLHIGLRGYVYAHTNRRCGHPRSHTPHAHTGHTHTRPRCKSEHAPAGRACFDLRCFVAARVCVCVRAAPLCNKGPHVTQGQPNLQSPPLRARSPGEPPRSRGPPCPARGSAPGASRASPGRPHTGPTGAPSCKHR